MNYPNISLKDVNGNVFTIITVGRPFYNWSSDKVEYFYENYLDGVKIDKVEFNSDYDCYDVILETGQVLQFKDY
jgi:hypothetical protein